MVSSLCLQGQPFHETESFFPSSQLQRENIQETEVLELSHFPLLQDFNLIEDDKDPTPTLLPKGNNEDKYFGKQYKQRQQELIMVKQQLQLSELEVRTHTCETLKDTLNTAFEPNLDNLPISLREKKIHCAKYPIYQFMLKKTLYATPEFSFNH